MKTFKQKEPSRLPTRFRLQSSRRETTELSNLYSEAFTLIQCSRFSTAGGIRLRVSQNADIRGGGSIFVGFDEEIDYQGLGLPYEIFTNLLDSRRNASSLVLFGFGYNCISHQPKCTALMGQLGACVYMSGTFGQYVPEKLSSLIEGCYIEIPILRSGKPFRHFRMMWHVHVCHV